MKQAYLFVHFREKRTPDGEQVHFALSCDGFHWEAVNGGRPVLWSFRGDLGVRDMAVIRCHDGLFRIFATDLSLAYGMPGKYRGSWEEISTNGSKCLMVWTSPDLLHWEKQQELRFDGTSFGCLWAPDILYDNERDEYLLHWSSTTLADGKAGPHAIWCSATRDFSHWTKPEILYRKVDGTVIDSAMAQEDGQYYLFLKSAKDPSGVILLKSTSIRGPFDPLPGGVTGLPQEEAGKYEAPAVFRLEDGRWCLMIDYFGVPGKGQGYVPFLADSLASGRFTRADEAFSFPYGFKHGTVLTITPEEYEHLARVGEWPEHSG